MQGRELGFSEARVSPDVRVVEYLVEACREDHV